MFAVGSQIITHAVIFTVINIGIMASQRGIIIREIYMIYVIQNFIGRNNPYAIAKSNGIEDAEDMFKWAFGLGYGSMLISKSHLYWNNLHSDLFLLYGSDNFRDSIVKICKEWKRIKNERL